MPYSAFIHRQKIEGLVNLDKSWMSTVANNPNYDILKSDYKRRCVVDTANVAIAEIKARGDSSLSPRRSVK